jgi:hypothetical protein
MAKPFEADESLQRLLDPHPTPEKFREALHLASRRSREEVVRLWLTEGVPFAFRGLPIAYEEVRTWLGARLVAAQRRSRSSEVPESAFRSQAVSSGDRLTASQT